MNKLKQAIYTSLILSTFLMIISILDGGIVLFPFVLIYSLAGNLAYGIPVSLLSDRLTRRLSKGRIMAAGFIHAFFGAITYFVIDGFAWFAVICAVIFFLVDEWLKRKNTPGPDRENKRFYLKLVSVVSVVAIVMLAVNWISSEDQGEIIKNRYLIPEGYEGTIVVFYGMPDRPSIEKNGEFSVIPVEIESLPTLMSTDIEKYGIYQTSKKEMGYNINQNQYFYVDDDGNRTSIEDYCIHHSVSGGVTGSDGTDISYDAFQVTNSDCGEDFYLDGNDRYSAQGREIVKYWSGLHDD
ncbi:DUF6843 domain-containing protein [uncultured Rossellomorea sp.]|uniref:DUF6843 domain-containing protein n=1 Tax=uncultured Rossellomorea sp. TaxID=2837549 RepID=UPI002605BACC|nr:hypothetical protein [uncultured Rossellomorea sp.]